MDDKGKAELRTVVGKTIQTVKFPDSYQFKSEKQPTGDDDIIQFTFTDGTVLTLASWDYEGYVSGIDFEIGNM